MLIDRHAYGTTKMIEMRMSETADKIFAIENNEMVMTFISILVHKAPISSGISILIFIRRFVFGINCFAIIIDTFWCDLNEMLK